MSAPISPEDAVRKFFDCYTNGRPEDFDECVAPDYVDYGHEPPGIGPDGARDDYENAVRQVGGLIHYTIDALVADGDMVAVAWTGTLPGGAEMKGLSLYRAAGDLLRSTRHALIGDMPTWAPGTADPGVFGGLPGEVGSGVVPDPVNRTQIEVDVVVPAPAEPGRPRKILSLGEAKWDRVMDLRHVERLRRVRDLLAVKGFDTRDTVLSCYSGAGFSDELQAAQSHDIRLIGLDQLYAD